jgi:hypothetical protein
MTRFDPVEGERTEAPVTHRFLQAQFRMQEPLPGEPSDNERHRKGVEKDRSKHALEADVLIDEHREDKAEHQRPGDEQDAEQKDMPAGRNESLGGEQTLELLHPDKVEHWEHLRTAEGEAHGPDHRADIDRDDDDGGGQEGEGCRRLSAPSCACPRADGCVYRP